MSEIRVSEVRAKKAELVAVLRKSIVGFQMETGVLVETVYVHHIDTTSVGSNEKSALTDVGVILRWDD